MEIGTLSKTETNPFYKSKYFDINSLIGQLMPLLEKHKLTVIQPISALTDGSPAINTCVYDGEKLLVSSYLKLPDINDPQKMGSAITYYRRYALQSLFLLAAEDDDANSTVKNDIKNKDLPF